MALISPIETTDDLPVQHGWSSLRKSFGDVLQVLTASLETSTVGVAFFDRGLRCHGFNRAFATMYSAPSDRFLGKTIHHSFGPEAKKLKPAFQRAFSRGAIVPNFELILESPTRPEPLHWLMNLYPVKDDRSRVQLVGATFSEPAGDNNLEFQIGHLVAKLQEGLPPKPALLSASFPEFLAHSLQSASRSVWALRDSASQDSLLAGMQIEIGLMPLALFLNLAELRSRVSFSSPSSDTSQASSKAPARGISDESTDSPSRRELEVLRHLATGKSNKEIALFLGISTRTVETYRARVTRKLSLHSTAELVRYAIRHNIIDP